MTIPTVLELSDSGKIGKLYAHNGRIIAEFLIDGPLLICAKNAVQNTPIEKGRPNIFRGALDMLEPFEILDCELETIYSKNDINAEKI